MPDPPEEGEFLLLKRSQGSQILVCTGYNSALDTYRFWGGEEAWRSVSADYLDECLRNG